MPYLGLWDVTAITSGTILGSAIFVAAAFVPRAVPHPTLALLLWGARVDDSAAEHIMLVAPRA